MGFGNSKKTAHDVKITMMSDQILGNLAQQDGNIHAMIFNLFGKMDTSMTMCMDEKVTPELESVLSTIQSQERQVVDVKMNTVYGGISGNSAAYHIIVLYR